MSSRSLLAARARRAGENPPPVSGNRPGTSIGSHAAFAPQPQGYQTNMPQPPPNVRVAKGQPVQQQQQQQAQQQQRGPSQSTNSMPFTKLSVSDAIGLITLRLGRVEQWIIETDHENEVNGSNGGSVPSGLPENSRIVDNSILSSIINRLEAVEKIPGSTSASSELSNSVTKLTEQLTKMGEDVIKHTMEISKHNEQMFRYNRELTETKDILKTFMIRYDGFVKETNDKFSDYEVALSELEKNVQVQSVSEDLEGTTINDINDLPVDNSAGTDNVIMSVDLKNIIKQELAGSTM